MDEKNKNNFEECTCCGRHGWRGGGRFFFLRIILLLIIVIFVFSIGFKLGKFSAYFENGYGYGSSMMWGGYGNYNYPYRMGPWMMYPYGYQQHPISSSSAR